MIYLFGAIFSEVIATLLLRVATFGSKLIWLPVTALYVSSYAMLALTLKSGVPVGIAYALWAALGLLITTVSSRIFFRERISDKQALGLVLIMIGVAIIKL